MVSSEFQGKSFSKLMWKVLLWVLAKARENIKEYVVHKENYLMLKVFWLLFLLIGQTDKTIGTSSTGKAGRTWGEFVSHNSPVGKQRARCQTSLAIKEPCVGSRL